MVSATHSTGHGQAVDQAQTQRPTLPGPVLTSSPTSSQQPWAREGNGNSGQSWVTVELRGATLKEAM